jgi:type II secretory pathway pseudopilin PulG
MNIKSKKALTLVEVIVSIAILALVSITLVGVIVTSANTHTTAQLRNSAGYAAAEQLEKRLDSLTSPAADQSDDSYISSKSHTIIFTLEGEQIICSGTLIESNDPDENVHMKGFYPNEE